MVAASKAYKKAWSDFYRIKEATQKEFDKGNMTPNAFTQKVKPALDKACNTPI